jgi:prepilin-type N-terminal cleavage/methylation domain-containing protein
VQKRRGFTLIEVVVVLIILGVLASIALPNVFSNIQKSQVEEAFLNVKAVGDQMTPCISAYSGSIEVCNCFSAITDTANFAYGVDSCQNFQPSYVVGSWSITALPKNFPNYGSWGTNLNSPQFISYINVNPGSVTITYSVGGTNSCSAKGIYRGVC